MTLPLIHRPATLDDYPASDDEVFAVEGTVDGERLAKLAGSGAQIGFSPRAAPSLEHEVDPVIGL